MFELLFAREFALWGVTIWSIAISIVIAVLYRIFIPKARAAENKRDLKEVREKTKAAQKSGDQKELKALMEKSLRLSNQQMMMQIKPMIASLVIVAIVLPVMSNLFGGIIFNLPFGIPLVNTTWFIFDGKVGWLGLYVIISFPVIFISRKLMGLD